MLVKNELMTTMVSLTMFFIIVSLASAQPTYTGQYCLDNSTLIRTISTDLTINGAPKNITVSEPVQCTYGCSSDTSSCMPDPFTQNIWPFGIGIGLIVLALIILRLMRVI